MRVRRPLALVYSRRPVSSIRAPCAADLTAQRQAATKESSTTFASITLRLRVHDSARFTIHLAQLLWCRTSSETGNAVMRMLGHATRLALLAVLDASCALNLVEMKPLAAAMLAKRWATDQAELDQKVGIRDDGVTVIYVEEYTPNGALDSLIQDTKSDDLPEGIEVLTLYTLEMAPDDSNDNYITLMTKNLENLKTGLDC